MEGAKKNGSRLFMLRDILFLLALLLNNGWVMLLALIGCVFTVSIQLRNDWKNNHRFGIITIIYVCLALALIFLLTYSIIASITQYQ